MNEDLQFRIIEEDGFKYTIVFEGSFWRYCEGTSELRKCIDDLIVAKFIKDKTNYI